jgi:hypothetical protein
MQLSADIITQWRQFPMPAVAQAAMDARKPEDHQRWFNNNTDRILRAQEQGYLFVLDDSGNPVKRVTGSDGSEQVLMTTQKIERNLKRRAGFDKFMARRSPVIAARIIQLNQTIDEGARVRGWHPGHTAKQFCFFRGCMSYNEFRKTYRPERWRALPPTAFVKHGKRKYLRVDHDMALDWWIGAVLRAGVTETIL